MSAAQAIGLDHQSEETDGAQASSLFRLTAEEQQARWHTIQLLSQYLASGSARKRELIAKELKACRQLYEAVWAEMSCAFHSTLVETTRRSIEQTQNS
jgi:uncharacterized protein YoaH (UPF0181 family)